MVSNFIRTVCFFLLLSCVNHDYPTGTAKAAVSAGCRLCHASEEDMEWLKTLVQKAENDFSLHGDIYVTSIDGKVVFVHQPMIMSCYACVLYDCEGNSLTPGTIDPEKLFEGMREADLIFRAI